MKFILNIELGNDAMQTFVDVGRTLEDLGKRLRNNYGKHKPGPDGAPIFDENGNKVGAWKFTRTYGKYLEK